MTEIEDRVEVESDDSLTTDSEFRDNTEDMTESLETDVVEEKPKVVHDSAFKEIFQLAEKHATHMKLRGSNGG